MLGEINIDWTLLYMEYFTLQKVICLVSFLQAEMNKKILHDYRNTGRSGKADIERNAYKSNIHIG